MTTSPTTTLDEQIAKLKAEYPLKTSGWFNPTYFVRTIHEVIDRMSWILAEREAENERETLKLIGERDAAEECAAMAVEDLPCKANCSYQRGHDFLPANGHWETCPAHYRAKYAARLQSVATASHKAGAEAMREKAARISDLVRDDDDGQTRLDRETANCIGVNIRNLKV